ncbi:MAG: hypothetical protein K8T20_14175 [Planctomycetes bacterium]|nr:hypothetical protein [Planctomycetota bacterium]
MQSKRPAAKKALHPILREMESEPIREDWLRLTPGQRLMIAWRQRRRIKDMGAAHDAKSLPRL